MWKRLTEDPNYINAVKCRYIELRDGILSYSYLHSFIDNYDMLLDEAQVSHFEQWDDLLIDDDYSPGGFWSGKLWFSAYRVSSYAEEIDILKGWLSARLNFLDNNLGGICLSTSVNSGDPDFFDLLVYPNPVSDILVVESSKALKSIVIYNMTGCKIAEKTMNNSDRFVLSGSANYTKELYTLQFLSGDGTRMSGTIVL
jgi:hypothetical protein